MIYQGWTCHWRGSVLVGRHSTGRTYSLGEVEVEDGGARWEVLRPDNGEALAGGVARDRAAARAAVTTTVLHEGGTLAARVSDHVLATVIRQPGISTAELAKDCGVSLERVRQVLAKTACVRVARARMVGGHPCGREYVWYPPGTAAPLDTSGAPSDGPGGPGLPSAAVQPAESPDGEPSSGSVAERAASLDDLGLVDRVLDEAGVLPGWPLAVRLGAALERLRR